MNKKLGNIKRIANQEKLTFHQITSQELGNNKTNNEPGTRNYSVNSKANKESGTRSQKLGNKN